VRCTLGENMCLTGYQIVNGAAITSINPATLRNPECLPFYADIGERLRVEGAV
jgi:acetoacetyl-CoA synthetase